MDETPPETPPVLQPPALGMEYDAIPDDQDTEDDEPEEKAPKLEEPRLYHFVARYDQNWDYKAICKKFFMEDKQWLCVKEHQNLPNTHVHFQGYSRLTPMSFQKKMTRLAHTHHIKKENPNSRPVSMFKRNTTELGFQYMAKELRNPLSHNMFTAESLTALKEASVLHCNKLKTVVKDYVSAMSKELVMKIIAKNPKPEELLRTIGRYLFLQHENGKIELPEFNPRHSRASLIRGVIANPFIPREYKSDVMFA
jgi:hypothetical protein